MWPWMNRSIRIRRRIQGEAGVGRTEEKMAGSGRKRIPVVGNGYTVGITRNGHMTNSSRTWSHGYGKWREFCDFTGKLYIVIFHNYVKRVPEGTVGFVALSMCVSLSHCKLWPYFRSYGHCYTSGRSLVTTSGTLCGYQGRISKDSVGLLEHIQISWGTVCNNIIWYNTK